MMGPGDIGSDPWDEFLARYFGRGEGGRRPPHRVDITRLMTADAREMLADAARRAAQTAEQRPGHRPPALGGAATRTAA